MQRGHNSRTAGAGSYGVGFSGACKYYANAKLHNKIEEAGLNLSFFVLCFISFIFTFFFKSFGELIKTGVHCQLRINTANFVCQVHFWIMICKFSF